jgi:hypothetical protein
VAKNGRRHALIRSFLLDWPKCSKNWFFAHRGSLHQETGHLVYGGALETVARRLFEIIDASAKGAFVPNQEKDELTYGL